MRSERSRQRWVFGGEPNRERKSAKRWADSFEEAEAYRSSEAEFVVPSPKPGRREVDQFCETLEFRSGDFAAPATGQPEAGAACKASARNATEAGGDRSPGAPTAPDLEGQASVLCRVEQFHGHWVDKRKRDLPCWLVSMVVHMALVIVLGSLAIPPGARQLVTATLLLSFAEEDAHSTSREPVALEQARSERNEHGESDHGESERRDHAAAIGLDGAEPAAALFAATELLEPSEHIALHQPAGGASLADAAPAAPPQVQSATQPQQPRAAASATAARTPPPEPKPAGDNQPPFNFEADAETERRLDQIVNRFIEYDIGHLQGAEGDRARREFDRLGPEAIPALLRGLNKSARIHASCPVNVISNKLGELAIRDGTPEMLSYVLTNIGKGVPASAPHAPRLQALRGLLGEGSGRPPLIFDAASLAQRLTSSQPEVRIEAARYITAHAADFGADDRTSLAWRLIRDLSDRRVEVRDAAHQALVALTDGEDFGPAEGKPASAQEVAAAASRWYSHFDQARYEAMAASVLASARHFEDAQRKTSAIRYYRKLREEYAGTKAADEAGKRLEELTGETF